MKQKIKASLSYKGIQCDSKEEIFFLQWLWIFKDLGVISTIERSESLLLSEPLIEKEIIQLKTKTKEVQKTILHGHIYTPEFKVKLHQFSGMERRVHNDKDVLTSKLSSFFCKLFRDNIELESPFVEEIGIFCYFEIKPQWDQNNMTRLFKINQKWVWSKYKIFINLVKPIELFEKTFIPKECWNDFFYKVKTKNNKIGDKKYNWEYKTFEEWVKKL